MAEPAAQQAAWCLEGVLQEAECKEQRQLGDGSSLVVLSRRDVLSQQDSMWLLLRSQCHLLSLSVRVPLQRFDYCHKLVGLVCTETNEWLEYGSGCGAQITTSSSIAGRRSSPFCNTLPVGNLYMAIQHYGRTLRDCAIMDLR